MIARMVAAAGLLLTVAACAPASDEPPAQVASAATILPTAATAPAVGEKALVRVWKSPTCDCCAAWVEHLREAGYPVQVENVDDVVTIKRARGIPDEMHGCHTAEVDGYLVEGHVPADAIDRMLAERPDRAGIAVPGMPAGSPGMAVPGGEGGYDVYAFGVDGKVERIERR